MKIFLLITVGMIAWQGISFAQCPSSGLKIQSAACEDPRNLQVDTVSCSELQVKWLGSKTQTYVVKATGTDPITGSNYQTIPSPVSCDNNGVCKATMPVKDGSMVSWSVQAVCSIQGAALYSSEVTGGNTRIPGCQKTPDEDDNKAIHIYPNPANDYLIVQYDGKVSGNTAFGILDITGKKLFSKLEGTAVKAANQYRLDVRGLPPGVYLLEAANDKSTHQSKFVILRN